MGTEKDWKPIEPDQNEELMPHRDPGEEMMFYHDVAAGHIDAVQDNCTRGVFKDPRGVGRLSDNPVSNLKYHFVVTVAMITRFCIEGGMPLEEAFGLSDAYIQRMDRCANMAEIVLLHDQMALDFAGRMRTLKKYAVTSRQVSDAIDYIYSHIRERITVNDIADAICISPAYLSRIFKQETGISISEYIRQRKIDMAKNLLRYSDYDLSSIAYMLSYSSQSHFIQHFRSQTGVTPKAYRASNYMSNWDVNKNAADGDVNKSAADRGVNKNAADRDVNKNAADRDGAE